MEEFTQPHRVEFDELALLNPHTDRRVKEKIYVAIAKGVGQQGQRTLREVAAIPSYLLTSPEILPGVQQWAREWARDQLEEDGYYSINSYWTGRRGTKPWHFSPEADEASKHGIINPFTDIAFTLPDRTSEPKRFKGTRINACYVDLDYYKEGLTRGQVIGAIIDATDEGRIPPPSYLKDSGQGLWVYWLLEDCKAFEPERDLHSKIEKRICQLFGVYGADPASKDFARYTRALGSINPKSQSRVAFMVLADDCGLVPRYKLKELAKAFGIVEEKKIVQPRSKPNPVNQAKGFKGQYTRWKYDWDKFWKLVEIRGTIKEGTRNAHILVCGAILKHRFPRESRSEEISIAAQKLFALFDPQQGYTLERLARYKVLEDGSKLNSITTELDKAASEPLHIGRKGISQSEISERLNITCDEAEQLKAAYPHGTAWAPSSRYAAPAPKPLNRNQLRDRRQAFILEQLNRYKELTDRELAEVLTEYGMPCDRTTVCRDRKAINKAITDRHYPNRPLLESQKVSFAGSRVRDCDRS
jgi:hypothetical protein